MLIAQFSDTHVKTPGKLAYGRVDTATMLQASVAHLAAMQPQPDLLLITGDLVDLGRPAEYAYLKSLLAPLQLPMLVIAGNHDERQALREAFADAAYFPASGFMHYDTGGRYPLRIIGLDTLVPLEGRGELCADRLDWLAQTLAAAPTQPTLVLMHHPPFLTGIAHMDALGLGGREAFAEIVRGHPQIKLILCGHLHRNIQTSVGGRPVLTCPSTAHQVALDLRAEAPSAFCMEPAGYMLHRWHGDQLVSHVVAVGDYAGPYPFFKPDGKLID
jgi:Icc protein